MNFGSLFFGDDSSVQQAFDLNMQNIAAGVAALRNAGITALPLLEEMNAVIASRYHEMDRTLRADFVAAKGEMLMALPGIEYETQRQMSSAMGEASAGMASGSYGTTIAAQQQAQIAGQAAGQGAMARTQVASQLAGLTAQQAQLSAGLGQAEMGARAGIVGQQANLIAGLAQSEAQMRGGISFQGQRTPGLLEMAAPYMGAALGGGINPFTWNQLT